MNIYGLSFKNFKRRKIRSILTMLGIVIGVVALVVLVGIGAGMQAYMNVQADSMKGVVIITNSSIVNNNGAQTVSDLSPDAVSQIKNMSQLYDLKEQVQFTSQLSGTPIMVMGLSDWSELKIINGTPGVVITKTLADQQGYKIGNKITVKDQEMTITGITEAGGGVSPMIVAINLDNALPMNDNKVTSITAKTKGDPKAVSSEIQSQVGGTTAMTQSDMMKQVNDLLKTVTMFVGAVAGIALLVGVISIINIMLVNVTERTREIGVLKAIGFTNREVLGSILSEAGLLGFLGSVAGVVIAAILLEVGVIFLVPQLGIKDFNLVYMLPLWLIAGVIAGATLLSVLAGLYPAWRASRLNVVEALRNE